MPLLETEEEAEKRINISSKTKNEEIKKEVDKIMKRIKTQSSSESDKEESPKDAKKGYGLKILTPNIISTEKSMK